MGFEGVQIIIWNMDLFLFILCCLMTVRLFRLRQKLFFEDIFIGEKDMWGTFVCVKLFLKINSLRSVNLDFL